MDDVVPSRLFRSTIRRYVDERLYPGLFCISVLTNDLRGSVALGDKTNKHQLPCIVEYVSKAVPSQARGSIGAVEQWLDLPSHRWS